MTDGREAGERKTDEFAGHAWNCVQSLSNDPLAPFPAFSHLRWNIQLALIKEAEGGNQTGLGTKSFHMGTGWVLQQYWPRGSQQRRPVSPGMRGCLCYERRCDLNVNVTSGESGRISTCPSGDKSHRPVFDMKKEGKVFSVTPPPSCMCFSSYWDVKAGVKFPGTGSRWGWGLHALSVYPQQTCFVPPKLYIVYFLPLLSPLFSSSSPLPRVSPLFTQNGGLSSACWLVVDRNK